jgi:brefeldin A-inhibited guanine nucleotide-exchange protein
MDFWISFAYASAKVRLQILGMTGAHWDCPENDTLARIGTSCLQQLLENNVTKLSPARWERITTTFVKLFRTTTPHQLFDEGLRTEIDGTAEVSEPNGQSYFPLQLLC